MLYHQIHASSVPRLQTLFHAVSLLIFYTFQTCQLLSVLKARYAEYLAHAAFLLASRALFFSLHRLIFALIQIIIALGGVVSLLATVGAARGLVYATLHNRFFT